MIYISLLIIPLIGVLWFLNFATFLKNLNNSKENRNQIILGAFLSFILLFIIMYVFIGTH
jgi:uncharacterized BrkB/YihY/UPF0761 family membrane protein